MFAQKPVAYFCAEYALQSELPTYAGGLGVLAGDFVREAAARGFPLVAVGLRYQKAQSVLAADEDNHSPALRTLVDADNREIIVTLPIGERVVSAKAREWHAGAARVYLLDTDIPENHPSDREITKCLYDEDRDTRLKQEIVLGIGGFRLLARLGIHAAVYHLNEGHSAFLALELVRHEMEHQGASFEDACDYAKRHILFTNHTLVPEGQEQFLTKQIGLYMARYAQEMHIKGEAIAMLGAQADNPDIFSMTTLSFRFSSKWNAVSRLHSEKALKIWPQAAIASVTNGVFAGRWDKIGDVPDREIWHRHLENKIKLLSLVRQKTGEEWRETDLLLVWARRLVEYKQPLLVLAQADKLLEIAKNSPVPLRLIFSGPTGGELPNPLVTQIEKIIEEKLKGLAVFIPNYSTELAELLTAGADVWLNTPKPGTEACGTSGMKAGLNGALSLSTYDGWVHEVEPSEIGWVVKDSPEDGLFAALQNEIIPLYAHCLKDPDNSEWFRKMTAVRNFIFQNFSTARVLKEYIEKFYIPILRQKHTHKKD